MFLFNMLPSVIVTIELLRATHAERNLLQKFQALHRSSKLFTLLALGQIGVIVGYGILDVVKLSSVALGGDRMYHAADGFLALFLVTHAILNCFFIENVSLITQLRHRMKTSSYNKSLDEPRRGRSLSYPRNPHDNVVIFTGHPQDPLKSVHSRY